MVNVSLIIPVYNEIRFIQKTLESVIGEADEIILSDNASTDGTSDICQSFANKYPEIKYTRHKENMGSAKNFLHCLDKANGEFIRILGGHDLIWPGSTEELLALLKNDKTAVVAYQNNCIFYNPDYTMNKLFVTNDTVMENKLQSDIIHERVSAIPYGIFSDAMLYSLYRAESLTKCISKYKFLPEGATDQGLLVILAKEGKILTEKKTACLLMISGITSTPINQKIYGKFTGLIEYRNAQLQKVTSLLSNPFFYVFAIICEQFNVAKELELSGMAAEYFAKNLLRNQILHFLKEDPFVLTLIKSEGPLYISDDKDNIREEVLSEIENIYNNQYYFIKKKIPSKIKYFIKCFVPFGLLELRKKLKNKKS